MKIKEKIVKTVNAPQVPKEKTSCPFVSGKSLHIVCQKFILRQSFKLSLVHNLFVIFHRNSGPCSYNAVLIKKCGFLSAYICIDTQGLFSVIFMMMLMIVTDL